MKASIIIPTLDRHRILEETITKLSDEKDIIEEIILVDQSDEIPEKFKKYVLENKIIKHFRLEKKNTPNARNFGIKKALSEIIIFFDDDIISSKNIIRQFLSNFNDKSIGGVSGRVINPNEKGKWTSGQSNMITSTGVVIPNWTSKIRSEINTVAGGNCAFRKGLIIQTGYFDDTYIGNAMREESDFALRFVKKGFKIIFDPKAEIIHLSYPAGGSRQKTRIDWYFDFFHNEYYFFLKHFSHLYISLFFVRKLRPILACMFYYGKGKFNAIKTPFLAFSAAKKDYDKLKSSSL